MVQQSDPPKTSSLSTRFSLRNLLIVITVFCLSLGWFVQRSYFQRMSVEAVIENGGKVTYSYHHQNGKYKEDASVPGPKWIRDLLGLDCLDYVYWVDFTDQDFQQPPNMKGLSRLRALWLRNTNVKDLEFISQFSALENLWLSGKQISNLSPVSKNRNLKWLFIVNTEINDLSPLDNLSKLRTLNVFGTNISTKELERFRARNPNCIVMGTDE